MKKTVTMTDHQLDSTIQLSFLPILDLHQGQHHVPVGPGDRGADDLVGPEDLVQHYEQVPK